MRTTWALTVTVALAVVLAGGVAQAGIVYWGNPTPTLPPLGTDLASMDFRDIIGTPLKSVVDAMTAAAKTTVDFVNNIGFTTAKGPGLGLGGNSNVREVLMINFNYNQSVNGTRTVKAMTIPFLFLVPIPFLQFDLTTLDLLVAISGVSSSETTNQAEAFGSLTNSWSNQVMTASAVSQWKSETSASITQTFHLAVHVQGSQAPLPEGMSVMLDLFDQIVSSGGEPVT